MSRSVWQSTKTGRDYGSPTPFAKLPQFVRQDFTIRFFRASFAAYLRLEWASALVVKRL
jgi:hypothetical protein